MPTPRKQPEQTITSPVTDISANLVRLRKERGLTQAQLAEMIGISRNLLANYELGRTHLTDESVVLLAKALRVTADRLLGLNSGDSGIDQPPGVRLVRRMQKIARLPLPEQKAILKTIDTFLKGAGLNNSSENLEG